MAAGNAQIGKLAPDFTAKAVMPDGQFKDLKMSDYRGTHVPSSVEWRMLWWRSLLDCDSLLCDATIHWIDINLHYWRPEFISLLLPLGVLSHDKQPYLFSLPVVQGNMLFFSSIPWTSPLCVRLRSSLSVMPPTISRRSAVRSSPPLLTRTSPILHGSYMTLYFRHQWMYGFTLAN